jgi:ATP-dependent DNA helicase RecG
MQWLKGNLNVRCDIEVQGGGPRKEIWEIPETVFKETIINALSHRDYYDKGAVIKLEVIDDRVEISNPRGLVSAILESEFGKRSYSKNPLNFRLFASMHLLEWIIRSPLCHLFREYDASYSGYTVPLLSAY